MTVFRKPIGPINPRIDELFKNLSDILNAGISFTDNVDCKLVSYASNATPDTEDTLAHGLGKTPTGFIVVAKDKAGDIYNGGTADDKTNIHLKCSVASVTATLLIF